jgi:hypothetical protein
MAARPLLQLIAHLLAVRERAGGAVHWHHIKAHKLCVLNDWVHNFMRFNRMLLNAAKCELVGRGSDKKPITAAAVEAAGLLVVGRVLAPVDHEKAIRYLGVQCRFDGSWQAQHDKITSMIQLFTRMVKKFSLTVGQASYVYNTFLLPKLDLGLRYICGPDAGRWC